MSETAENRVGPMLNPPHSGESVRDNIEEVDWSVTETAATLGCQRGTLSQVLNGKAGVSTNLALALESIGWGSGDHWKRMQASYELAKKRRELENAERRKGGNSVSVPCS